MSRRFGYTRPAHRVVKASASAAGSFTHVCGARHVPAHAGRPALQRRQVAAAEKFPFTVR
jgi:hypothetical protein